MYANEFLNTVRKRIHAFRSRYKLICAQDKLVTCYCRWPTYLHGIQFDKELLSNYRPISNLSFLSKLSERVVLSRLKGYRYLTSNNLLNPNQSAYTKHHSTETLLNYLA